MNNQTKILQVRGGTVGLYENPDALVLFVLAGPDWYMIGQQCIGMLNTTSSGISHHEEASNLQITFYKDVI